VEPDFVCSGNLGVSNTMSGKVLALQEGFLGFSALALFPVKTNARWMKKVATKDLRKRKKLDDRLSLACYH
jgi:hypothetical protein